jgi:VanZ family protein
VRRLLGFTVAFLIYASLYPFLIDVHRAGSPVAHLLLSWPAEMNRFLWRDVVENVVVYIPLGLAATILAMRRVNRGLAMLGAVGLGGALSTSIELVQYFDASRTSSLQDVASNAAGTILGALLALRFRSHLEALPVPHWSGRSARGAMLLWAAWFGHQLLPMIPVLGLSRLRLTVLRIFDAPLSGVEMAASAAEWFAALVILEALARQAGLIALGDRDARPAEPVAGRGKSPVSRYGRLVWLAVACLPLRLLILDRVVTVNELIGAAVALLVWSYPAAAPRFGLALAALASAIVLRDLAPFHFTLAARPMNWIPFAAGLEAERQSATLIILRKGFDYGGVLWLAHERGMRYSIVGMACGAGLLLLETAQRFMTAHEPEITDPLLALVMASLLWGLERRRR